MSYIINNSRGNIVAVVDDGTVNTTATDLALVGRSVINYGEYQNENYVYLLENFADSAAPLQPILGQLWYNSSTDTISAYSTANTWAALASQNYVDAQKISPIFTGVPQAPTASVGTATTQLATTAFVTNGPAFAGVPTAPTATAGTSNTQIATTAFVTISPVFTGTPTAPTASVSANTTQVATTEFVQNNKDSPVFTGIPQAPTASIGTNTTQVATTAFVQNSPQFLGTPTAPTAAFGANDIQLATTAFVQGEKNSPTFTGIPEGPTPIASTNSAQLATTAFVQNNKASPAFSGVPTAPTASVGTATTQLATTAFVTNGPEFAGLPTAPTASVGTNTTQLATTAFVQNQVNALGTMSTQNSNSVTITGGTITGITDVAVADGGTGASTAADARTNLAVPPNTRTVTGSGGLTGGGDLSADRTITIASNSNGYGIRYVSTVAPNIAGVSGDVWYQII
jgi:hypothetical protein